MIKELDLDIEEFLPHVFPDPFRILFAPTNDSKDTLEALRDRPIPRAMGSADRVGIAYNVNRLQN